MLYFVDALVYLRVREVTRESHPGRIIEGTLNGQIAMDDVVLGDITELGAEGCQVAIIILSVVEDLPLRRGPQPIEGVHQR